MMRLIAAIAMLVLCSVSPALAQSDSWSGNVNLFLGGKFLDEDDWAPADDQFEIGLLFDIQPPGVPISLAADFLFGFSDGLGLDVEIHEYDLGIRKIFDQNPQFRPYIGGGLAIVSAEISGFGASIDDDGFGGWIGGGFFTTIQEHFNIGVDMRFSTADVTLGGFDFDAGGFHVGLITGYHW
ncbi:MAG: outer membrane beta-barrel protein [Nitrospirota bacterium]